MTHSQHTNTHLSKWHTPAILVRSVIYEWNPVAGHLVESKAQLQTLQPHKHSSESETHFLRLSWWHTAVMCLIHCAERNQAHLFNGLLVVDRVNYADHICLSRQIAILTLGLQTLQARMSAREVKPTFDISWYSCSSDCSASEKVSKRLISTVFDMLSSLAV